MVEHTNVSPFTGSGMLGISLNPSDIISSSLKTHIKIILEILCRFKNNNHHHHHLDLSVYCGPGIVLRTGYQISDYSRVGKDVTKRELVHYW